MAFVDTAPYAPLVDDPDDYRPASSRAMIVDPGGPEGMVNDLAVVLEKVGPGEHQPLHRHPAAEVVTVLAGEAEVRLHDDVRRVPAGGVVFVPPHVPHSISNVGDEPLQLQSVFPTVRVGIAPIERNPQPGTEDQRPMYVVHDPRTGRVEVLGASRTDV